MKILIKHIPKPVRSFLKPLYFYLRKTWLGYLIVPRQSREELHDYWRNPGGTTNAPETYIFPVERSEFLFRFIRNYITPETSILEIGSGVGRNLEYLFSAGYRKLSGIEISEEAVALMRKTYPEMSALTTLHIGSVEEVIKDIPNDAFDVSFTMATLEAIHKDSEWIFPEIVRITKKYLITIEDEGGVSTRHFPRNYQKIFELLDMKQVEVWSCADSTIHGISPDFWVRVFAK